MMTRSDLNLQDIFITVAK